MNSHFPVIRLAGSVYATDWEDISILPPWLIVCLPLVIYGARDLNALNLDEDVAQGLGLRLTLKRAFLLLLSVALASIIGFVRLIAPHLARRLVGSMHEGLVPTAALVGLSRNGCGKFTFLRGLARLIKPKVGSVLLNGHAIQTMP